MKKLIILIILLFSMNLYGADVYVTDMTEDTSPTSDDIIYVINDPGGTPADRKATIGNILGTNLSSIRDLTFADLSILQLTGAGGIEVLTCIGANQLIGVNAAGTALECKSILNITTINLPSSDADPGTTAGQIRHDSSSTEADTAARGVVKWFDGTNVRTVVDTGTSYFVVVKTEYLPIRYAEDGTTPPAATAEIGTTTAVGRSFTEGDDVVFWWIVPNDYVGGIKYRVFYALSQNALANETVIFSMAGSIIANSAALTGAAGTALTITDELTTDEDTSEGLITDYSAESNADWSLAAGALARLEFSNAVAGDYTGEPLVIGIEIKYKAKIIGFAGY